MTDLVLGVTLKADGTGFVGEVKIAKDQLRGLGDEADKAGRKSAGGLDLMGGALGKLKSAAAGAIAAFVGFSTIERLVRAAADEIMAFEKSQANLNAVLRATGGAAGLTADEINRLADSLEESTLFDDAQIRQAASVMLTFRKVTGDTFREAISLATDLSGLLGGDLQGATVMLGKALQDPVEGVSALRRVGISLTPVQERLIKTFMETGQQAKAMRVILDEVAHQVGGVAKSQVVGLTGATNDLSDAWGDLLKSFKDTAAFGIAVGAIENLARAMRGIRDEERIAQIQKAMVSRYGDTAQGAVNRFLGLTQETDPLQAELDQLLERRRERQRLAFTKSLTVDGALGPPAPPADAPPGPTDDEIAKLKERQKIIAQFHLDQVIQQEKDWADAQQRGADMVKAQNDAIQKQKDAVAEAGRTLTEQLMTPQEKYNASLAEYRRLLEAGAISQATFARAVTAAGKELAATDAIANELGDTFDQAFDRIGESITDAATRGKFQLEDLGNVGSAVISELMQELLKLSIINPIKNSLFDSGLPVIGDIIDALLGGGVPTNSAGFRMTGAGPGASGSIRHEGGMVGPGGRVRNVSADVFAGAPRFHNGGLVAGEVPIIAKQGEEVGWPGQLAEKYGAKVQVTVINSTGQPSRTEERRGSDGRREIAVYIGDMMAADIRSGGRASQAMEQAYGLKRGRG